MRHALFLTLVLGLSTTAFGCGSDAAGDRVVTCSETVSAACGGSPIGSWLLIEDCWPVDNPACPGWTEVTVERPTEQLSFATDGTVVDSASGVRRMRRTLPRSCLAPGQSCSSTFGTGTEGLECISTAATCSCSFVHSEVARDQQGRFTVEGNRLTLAYQEGIEATSVSFCRVDDQLVLWPDRGPPLIYARQP